MGAVENLLREILSKETEATQQGLFHKRELENVVVAFKRLHVDLSTETAIEILSPAKPDVLVGEVETDPIYYFENSPLISYDYSRRQVTFNDTREPVRLSPSEADLMDFFCKNPSVVIDHQKLLKSVYKESAEYVLSRDGTLILKVYIHKIRQKIELKGPERQRHIIGHPFRGYEFVPEGIRKE